MSYTAFDISTSEVRDLARKLGYRKRKARVVATERVTLTDLNWSGGTRSTYTAVDLAHGGMITPDLGRPHPMDNAHEGRTVDIPPNIAIVRTGTFCGKPGRMTIYVRPENLPRLVSDVNAC